MNQPPHASAEARRDETSDFVTALARGLAVIRAFGMQSRRMSLAEIARHVNLPRATVRRSLITLETLGYVESDSKTFMLTPQVLSLGYSYLTSLPVTRAVRPYLEKMTALFNEPAAAAILDHDDAVFLARVSARRVFLGTETAGSRLPAYCTAMGRVLLAAQPDAMIDEYLARIEPRAYTPHTITNPAKIRDAIYQARRDSYSIVQEEFDAGIVAISVPIKDLHDRTVAALNVVSHVERASREQMLDRFLPYMRNAVQELRCELP